MNESERWVTLSALGAAMFAVGFSFAGVACSTRDTSETEALRAQSSSRSATLTSASAATIASAPAAIDSARAPSTRATSAAIAVQAAHDGLRVKRVVVTHQINDREPALGDEFRLGSAPVYAFVELENSASEARSIRVVFRNQDTEASVGHVKLTVPPAQARFRTWGNTRMIQDPGHWVAVVSTSDGIELGRAEFEVKS